MLSSSKYPSEQLHEGATLFSLHLIQIKFMSHSKQFN